jgi:hypothetical protein
MNRTRIKRIRRIFADKINLGFMTKQVPCLFVNEMEFACRGEAFADEKFLIIH